MPHSINARQVFEQMGGSWPKSSAEVIDWARAHDAFPNPLLKDLQTNLPDRTWNDWDELRAEVENYTWTMPDNEDDEEEVVWGGATRHDTV